VTFTIGGNDAEFANSLAECILGFELLPFNTCYNDEKVTKPTLDAFARLDNRTDAPANIVPYDDIFKDARRNAPFATVVAVGYPPFFSAQGSDRTFLPGGRCEGVKKADQRWIVEQIAELNSIIESNALRNGYLFADPSDRFATHQLCGEDTEWFFPLLSGGRVHPTAEGHNAVALEIEDVLNNDGYLRHVIFPEETKTYTVIVDELKELLSFNSFWPGSDVVMSLVTPSGGIIDRTTVSSDIFHENGPGYEQYEILNPELGVWTVNLYGDDVAINGEEVRFSSYQKNSPNIRPEGSISWTINNQQILLDASASQDGDGQIESIDWYVSESSDDFVYVGANAVHSMTLLGPIQITLVITDDEGLTAFETLNILAMDIKPGSDDNSVNLNGNGVLPTAFLSTSDFDATLIDPSSLRMTTGGSRIRHPKGHIEDVNNDGLSDLLVHFNIRDLVGNQASTAFCVSGQYGEDVEFESCDNVRVVGKKVKGKKK